MQATLSRALPVSMKASRLSVVLAATSSRHLLLSSAFAQPGANIQRHRLESALMSSPATCNDMDTGNCFRSCSNLRPTHQAKLHGSINPGYLNAKDAAALDAELMSTPGFSLEQVGADVGRSLICNMMFAQLLWLTIYLQLMELAGMSVAEALYDVLSGDRQDGEKDRRKKHVLIVCGPGRSSLVPNPETTRHS